MSAAFDAGFIADPRSRADIAAEASSGFSTAPSYDELWSRARRPAPQPAPGPAKWSFWPAAFALLASACVLIGARTHIVRAAPLVAPAYAAVGLPVNLIGLELRNVRSRILLDGARKVLEIEGEIANVRRESNRVPPVALTVLGADGQPKYAWTAQAPKAKLEAGETIAFRARLAAPPESGSDVLVRFAKGDTAKAEEKAEMKMRTAPRAAALPIAHKRRGKSSCQLALDGARCEIAPAYTETMPPST